MADIQLRFGYDVLILSSPARAYLERLDAEIDHNAELTMLVEPEVYDDFYDLENAVGAQCLVTDTAVLTPARLAHSRLEGAAEDLAATALRIVNERNPQHVLVEIGPCGLPLDPSSKGSLVENRDQYARAALLFADMQDGFDAFFLNGFESTTDLKCALMGIRKVSDKPVFASVDIDEELERISRPDQTGGGVRSGISVPADEESVSGLGASADDTLGAAPVCPSADLHQARLKGPLHEPLKDAVAVMAEYGAQVAGIRSSATPDALCGFVRQMRSVNGSMPILVQIDVKHTLARPDFSDELIEALGEHGSLKSDAASEVAQQDKYFENPQNPEFVYFQADSMMDAANSLMAEGVQFLRAVGRATPSYTGALVGSTIGDMVKHPGSSSASGDEEDSSRLTGEMPSIEALKAKVNDALKG